MCFNDILVCTMIIIMMVYTIMNHDYHGISHDFLLKILINCIPVCRIQLLWCLCFPTALRRIATLFPWKTAGMPVHSSTSHVFCVQRMIRSKGWYIEVYSMMRMLYSMMRMLYTQSISCKHVFFTFGCRIGCAVHGVCMLA